jgi:hypothetical protein
VGSSLLAFLVVLLEGCVSVSPGPPEGLAFALLGDVPYSQPQANLLEGVIDEMNRERLAFVVHVGDITSGTGPCGDEWLEARRRQFERIAAPFVLLAGDNEWTDCHRTGFDPLERLGKWRSLFCVPLPALRLERQPGRCEHVRWSAGGALFVGLNVPGSNNNLGRTPEMDAEHQARMRDVFAWLDEAERRATDQRALVVLMQANPDFEQRERRRADGYAALRARLREIAARFGKPLLLVHGDTHYFRDDAPVPGLRRVEVWGSPYVRWVRARMTREGFRIEQAP